MKKIIFGVIGLTFLAKIFGFLREILLSYYFGASGISDAYLISQTIPGTIFQFVGVGLTTCFIPVFLKVLSQKGKKEADELTNQVISIVLLFSTVVIVLVWAFTRQIVGVFAAGFEGATLNYAITFTRISVLSLYLSAIVYVFTSYLQAQNRFWIVAFAAIPNSLVIMLSIVLASKLHVMFLNIGSVCAIAVQLAVIGTSIGKLDFKLRIKGGWKSEPVSEIFRLLLPVMVGVSVNEINVLVDRTLASMLSEGAISALMYANSLILFVQGAFSQTVASVYYPTLTRMAEENQVWELKSYLAQAIRTLALLLCPITVGVMLLAKDIVQILYGRGAFDANALQMTSAALFFYAIGIVGSGLREIFSRFFYAFHDTKTPMKNATLGFLLNIVLNFLLSKLLGIGGLALSTSIASIFTAILLWVKIRRRIGKVMSLREVGQLLKIVCISMVMGVAVMVTHNLLFARVNQFVLFVVCVLCGILVYGVGALICRIDAVYDIIKGFGTKKVPAAAEDEDSSRKE